MARLKLQPNIDAKVTLRFQTQEQLLTVKRAAKQARVSLNRFVTDAALAAAKEVQHGTAQEG